MQRGWELEIGGSRPRTEMVGGDFYSRPRPYMGCSAREWSGVIPIGPAVRRFSRSTPKHLLDQSVGVFYPITVFKLSFNLSTFCYRDYNILFKLCHCNGKY